MPPTKMYPYTAQLPYTDHVRKHIEKIKKEEGFEHLNEALRLLIQEALTYRGVGETHECYLSCRC